jgi:hypothetical protein
MEISIYRFDNFFQIIKIKKKSTLGLANSNIRNS